MSDDFLIREDLGAVTRLTMNRPNALNALSEGMLDALQSHLDQIKTDSSVKAVVIAGAGKAFCAGHDLKEMTNARSTQDGGKQYFLDLFKTCTRMMLTIRDLPQPVIAQVHGIATAAGCQLVATCDMAVGADGTKFGVNGVNIGLFCSTPMVALSRNIPRKKAFELLTTGEFLSAEQAVQQGLLNQSVPFANLSDATLTLAQKVASKLSAAVKIGKPAFYQQLEMPVEDAYAFTGAVMAENMMLPDTQEGIAAFLEKRDPNWKSEI